jgi:hypothetical protein
LTRRGLVTLLAWTAYLMFANVAWLREQLPQRPPSWDRALYLYLSVRFLHALERRRARGTLRGVRAPQYDGCAAVSADHAGRLRDRRRNAARRRTP